jgi:hypothetical protein
VLVAGYGGVSRLCCSEEATTMSSVRGYPCVGIQNFSLGKVKEVAIHNVGMRPAQVRVAVFKGIFHSYPSPHPPCLFMDWNNQ